MEVTLNALLDAKADQLCGPRKYEPSAGRKDRGSPAMRRRHQVGHEALFADEQVGRNRDHRLIVCSSPPGDQSK